MLHKIKNFLSKKTVVAPSYFDLSAREKKEIIKKAAKESNKLQEELIEKYNKSIASI